MTLRDLPEPQTLKDLDKAAAKIAACVREKRKIALVGDYDVDGVVSTALMREFFEYIDYPVQIIIPNRFTDGYGLSEKIIDRIDADLVITVDNGISAQKAAQKCKERGMELIITDHHSVPETLPEAYAIVNPKQECCDFSFSEICGAQVAWYLIAHLKKVMGLKLDMKNLLDLLCIAVIADVMPLTHINRTFVKAGLQMLARSKRPCVLALKNAMGKEEFGSEDVGFYIAPRLNSAGRMEDAKEALEFLCAKQLDTATHYLERLESLNALRKDTEEHITAQAIKQVRSDAGVIVVSGEDWHEGVVGIVASRLSERFKKPAIVLGYNGEYYKGSGRSYGDTDLFSLIKSREDLLKGFGGHRAAAGLSLESSKLEAFTKAMAAQTYPDPSVESFCLGRLDFEHIDWELLEILQRFEPYGEKNPKPTFISEDIHVAEARRVGQMKEHVILTLQSGYYTFKGIYFKCEREIKKGDRITMEYSLEKNSFQNRINIQLQLKNIVS